MAIISPEIGVKQEIKVNSTASSRKDQHKHNHQNHNNKRELNGGKKRIYRRIPGYSKAALGIKSVIFLPEYSQQSQVLQEFQFLSGRWDQKLF